MSFITGDIVTKVQQRVRDTSYSSSEIMNYLNDTQNDVFNEYRLPFMETTQDYTLTVGVSDVTNGVGLPANFVQAIDVILTTSGQEKLLTYTDIREIDRSAPDPDDENANSRGAPSYWYNYANTIRVFPEPDAAYTLTVRYYKKPTILADNPDVPEIPSEFEELLVSGASYRVLQVKDNYDQAGIHENKYQELLQKLVAKYSQKQVGSPTIMRINYRGMGKTNF